MRLRLLAPLTITCLLLSAYLSSSAQDGNVARRRKPSPLKSPGKIDIEKQKVVESALKRLRILRDGWNDVNREFIKPDFVVGSKHASRDYEVQYLEAKSDVAAALEILHKGQLHTAIKQAMELFDDLEEIEKIFDKKSPFTTGVHVSDIFPYLKKYKVPYESGIIKNSYGLTLHQDFVMSYILPLRYARVNRIEVLLGGKVEPIPPSPTYEQMFRVPAARPMLDRASVRQEVLKDIIRRAIEAKLRGDKARISHLLDDLFIFSARQGRQWDKEGFLKTISLDPTVKGFEIEQTELSFRQEAPVITIIVKYESLKGEFKSFSNTFMFVNQNGRWLIARWRSF